MTSWSAEGFLTSPLNQTATGNLWQTVVGRYSTTGIQQESLMTDARTAAHSVTQTLTQHPRLRLRSTRLRARGAWHAPPLLVAWSSGPEFPYRHDA